MKTSNLTLGPWKKFEVGTGLFPFVSIGWATFWCCQGSPIARLIEMAAELKKCKAALADAAAELKRRHGD